jgi:hypothetical protein
MQDNVCVIPMVRDDNVMLRKFVSYYGGLFGKEALYIINHGNQQAVREIAAGCNLIPIPDNRTNGFTARRWRTQNNLMTGLRQWFTHVIVVDVDEFVVVDPASGEDLGSFMAKAKARTVRTAFGLEIVHLPDREKDGIEPHIIGPRRFATINSWYSKPCIISHPTKLSRGGHFASHETLDAPASLYLFHMKYCDVDLYAETLDRRGEAIKAQGVSKVRETTTNRQWFANNRDDDATFKEFSERIIDSSFDFSMHRKMMQNTFRPRSHELHHFDPPKSSSIYEIPQRFFGIV